MIRLRYATPAAWFDAACSDLGALLSDHLHCERKAAENALSLVRRYPRNAAFIEQLTRLAHEETSHLVQVAALMEERHLVPRSDAANRYARALLAEVDGREPGRKLDLLLTAAFIEARSHERLGLLATGFAAQGDAPLADFYTALGGAEERHARLYIDLAGTAAPAATVRARLDELAIREGEIVAALPHRPRIH